MPKPTRFDANAKAFVEYSDAPWGRIRTDMVSQQLAWHLPTEKLRILDVGCGPAQTAIHFATLGHDVTCVDFSSEMLKQAKEQAQSADVTIKLIECDALDVPQMLPHAAFDLVLCHFVLEYMPDNYVEVVHNLATMLKTGGYLSLMTTNLNSLVLKKAVIDLKPEEALGADTRQKFVNMLFGGVSRRYKADEIGFALDAAKLHQLQHYGVRIFNDLIANNEIKHDSEFYANLLALELHYCQQDPFREIAASTHWVARKL